jgi:hypothetical protein
MLLTKTILVAAAIASGLLASPPAAAAPRRIPEPPPWPIPRAQHCENTVAPSSTPASQPPEGLVDLLAPDRVGVRVRDPK